MWERGCYNEGGGEVKGFNSLCEENRKDKTGKVLVSRLPTLKRIIGHNINTTKSVESSLKYLNFHPLIKVTAIAKSHRVQVPDTVTVTLPVKHNINTLPDDDQSSRSRSHVLNTC